MNKKIIAFLIVLIIIIITCCFIYCLEEYIIRANNGIPKLYIVGNINNMNEKTDKRQVYVKYRSADLNFDSYATLSIQGAYSVNFDKKNYNIIFYANDRFNEKKEVNFKWGNYKKYTLKANWTDQLHGRNIVTANLAAQVYNKYNLFTTSVNNGFTDGFPVEIYENDKFLGLYTINLHKDFLLNLDEKNKNNLQLLSRGLNMTTFGKRDSKMWSNFEVEIGEENKENLAKLDRLISFINDSTPDEFVENFDKYFNMDSVLNYYCLMQFAQLTDNVVRNVMLVTYDGEIWYTIPYDLELSWGNHYISSTTEKQKGEIILQDFDNSRLSELINQSALWRRIQKFYPEEIKQRYAELREEIFTKENIINQMNEFYNSIPSETLNKEHQKWNNQPDYDISYLEDYLDTRIKLLDELFEYNLSI